METFDLSIPKVVLELLGPLAPKFHREVTTIFKLGGKTISDSNRFKQLPWGSAFPEFDGFKVPTNTPFNHEKEIQW